MSVRRYKFDFRDQIGRLRVKGAKPHKALDIKVRVANDASSPAIPARATLDIEGNLRVTFTTLEGEAKTLHLVHEVLMWEIHCREVERQRCARVEPRIALRGNRAMRSGGIARCAQRMPGLSTAPARRRPRHARILISGRALGGAARPLQSAPAAGPAQRAVSPGCAAAAGWLTPPAKFRRCRAKARPSRCNPSGPGRGRPRT